MWWRLQTVQTCMKSLKTSRNGEHIIFCAHIHTHTFSAVIRHILLNVADFQCVRKLLQNTWRPSVWPFHDSTSSPPLISWTSSPMATSPLWYDYNHVYSYTTNSNMHNTRCDNTFCFNVANHAVFTRPEINNIYLLCLMLDCLKGKNNTMHKII